MALVQKQPYVSMEQNREPRNKPIHLKSINLPQRREDYEVEIRQCLQQVILRLLNNYMEINDVREHPHTMQKQKQKQKTKLKMA